MAGPPLLFLAQPIVLTLGLSRYKGMLARHLPVSLPLAITEFAILAVWMTLMATAARRHRLTPWSSLCCFPRTGWCTGSRPGAGSTS
jgi:hypothetical protein